MPIIDYDTAVSPPTYGDFIMVVMFARYMSMIGNVKFRIVCSQFREDWDALDFPKRTKLLADFEEIATLLVGDVEVVSGPVDRNPYRVYPHALNALNPILVRHDAAFLDKYLLKPQDFEGCAHGMYLEPYIAWHVRQNDQWAPERNLTNFESIKVYHYLRSSFPDKQIMIVSDKEGCDRYRVMFPNLLYSKDYSDSYLGDCELSLSSDFFFQQRAGGMGVVPLFSRLPYEIRAESGFLFLNGAKATSWASEDQNYINEPLTLPTHKTLELLREEEPCLLQT